MTSVTTRVPASTSNLGPGFDCLGVALGIYNQVTVRMAPSAQHPAIVNEVGAAFFAAARLDPFAFGWDIDGEVPRARGLGSSVTVRLGLLHGLNVLAGSPFKANRLFEICAALEGHPDNAAPAAFGGFTVAREGAETLRAVVEPTLKFVLVIPDFEVATPEARAVLPDILPRKGAVLSVANACRITAAFFERKYELLRGAFGDGVHQPFREPLIPFLGKVITAGEKAGALGGFLSGSGSTICCLALDDEQGVAAAMLDASPPHTQVRIATADNIGAEVLEDAG